MDQAESYSTRFKDNHHYDPLTTPSTSTSNLFYTSGSRTHYGNNPESSSTSFPSYQSTSQLVSSGNPVSRDPRSSTATRYHTYWGDTESETSESIVSRPADGAFEEHGSSRINNAGYSTYGQSESSLQLDEFSKGARSMSESSQHKPFLRKWIGQKNVRQEIPQKDSVERGRTGRVVSYKPIPSDPDDPPYDTFDTAIMDDDDDMESKEAEYEGTRSKWNIPHLMQNHQKPSLPLDPESQFPVKRGPGAPTHITVSGLRRQLKPRHVTMISIGGVVGTGLFLSSSTSLRHSGPLGILLSYLFMGSVVACVVVSLGEMIAQLPVPGGHISLSSRFGDPALSFAIGWFYWYTFTFILPAELSAAAVLMDFWRPGVPPAVWVILFLVVVTLINVAGARYYGEFEFWFASIKVVTIIGLIIVGIVIDTGGGPHGNTIGFEFWKHPGAFAQYNGISGVTGRFLAFWSSVPDACFAYVGCEIFAIASAEARAPRRNIPRAVRGIFARIFIFYICSIFVIGLLVESDDPSLSLDDGTAHSSPFVIAIKRAGINVLPDLINGAILISAWSCASSNLYTSSRAMYGMAISGSAPRLFAKMNRWGLPYLAVGFGACFGLLGLTASNRDGAGRTFKYFSSMSTVGALMTWGGVCLTYIRFHHGMKIQNFNRDHLPFKAPFQPYLAWYGLVWCFLIALFSGFDTFLKGNWSTSKFVTSYVPLACFGILWGGYKKWFGTELVPYEAMDFVTGSAEHDEEDSKQRTELQKLLSIIF